MVTRVVSLIALVASIVVHPGVGAGASEIVPTFAEQQVWFRCTAPTRLQNAHEAIGWTATPPAQSVQAGAGCGFADVGTLYNDTHGGVSPQPGPFDPVFEGDVTGNLTNLTVDLYTLGRSAQSAQAGRFGLFVWLSINGRNLFYGPDQVVVPAEQTNSGVTDRLSFALTDLEQFFDLEDGDGEQTHHVILNIAPWSYTDAVTWVWDTTEVPAGITFNDTTPPVTRIRVRPGDGA